MINLVRDHAKSPIPTAPSLVPVVVGLHKLRWHVRRVSAVPRSCICICVCICIWTYRNRESKSMLLLTSHCQCQDKVLGSLSNLSCLDTMVLLPVCTPGGQPLLRVCILLVLSLFLFVCVSSKPLLEAHSDPSSHRRRPSRCCPCGFAAPGCEPMSSPLRIVVMMMATCVMMKCVCYVSFSL